MDSKPRKKSRLYDVVLKPIWIQDKDEPFHEIVLTITATDIPEAMAITKGLITLNEDDYEFVSVSSHHERCGSGYSHF